MSNAVKNNMPIEVRDFNIPLSQVSVVSGSDTVTLTDGGWGIGTLAQVGTVAGAGTTKTHTLRVEVPLPPELAQFSSLVAPEAAADFNPDIKLRAELTGTPATAANIDIEARQADGAGGVGSDLNLTAQQNMLPNGTSSAQYSFEIDGSGGLTPGGRLIVYIRNVLNDGGGSGGGTFHLTEILLSAPCRG